MRRANESGFEGSNLLMCIALFLVPDWSPFFVSLSISFEWEEFWFPFAWDFEEVMNTSLAGTTFARMLKANALSFSRSRSCFQWIVPLSSPSSSSEE